MALADEIEKLAEEHRQAGSRKPYTDAEIDFYELEYAGEKTTRLSEVAKNNKEAPAPGTAGVAPIPAATAKVGVALTPAATAKAKEGAQIIGPGFLHPFSVLARGGIALHKLRHGVV